MNTAYTSPTPPTQSLCHKCSAFTEGFLQQTLQILTTYKSSFVKDKNSSREVNFKIAYFVWLLFIWHMIKQVKGKALGLTNWPGSEVMLTLLFSMTSLVLLNCPKFIKFQRFLQEDAHQTDIEL